VDDGFVLSESRAILGYLAEKYANDSAYYPSDPMARAVVNQRLMFDIGTLFQQIMNTYMVRRFSTTNVNVFPTQTRVTSLVLARVL